MPERRSTSFSLCVEADGSEGGATRTEACNRKKPNPRLYEQSPCPLSQCGPGGGFVEGDFAICIAEHMEQIRSNGATRYS